MELRFHKALWGFEGQGIPSLLDRIKRAGYEGFETPVGTVRDHAGVVKSSGLEFIGMSFPDEVDTLKKDLEAAVALGAVMLNVHAGRGYWPMSKGAPFFEAALKDVVQKSPIPVVFETHRGRLLYEPQSTHAYIQRFPELRLTADFSHWTCVCESMLQGQEEAVSLALRHTDLIHARVGHEEGPQVPDPRAPEWAGHVAAHVKWWREVASHHAMRGSKVLRIDPEFGPPNYMPTLPYTRQAVTDLWDICAWMRDHLKKELADLTS